MSGSGHLAGANDEDHGLAVPGPDLGRRYRIPGKMHMLPLAAMKAAGTYGGEVAGGSTSRTTFWDNFASISRSIPDKETSEFPIDRLAGSSSSSFDRVELKENGSVSTAGDAVRTVSSEKVALERIAILTISRNPSNVDVKTRYEAVPVGAYNGKNPRALCWRWGWR